MIDIKVATIKIFHLIWPTAQNLCAITPYGLRKFQNAGVHCNLTTARIIKTDRMCIVTVQAKSIPIGAKQSDQFILNFILDM